MKEEIKIKYIYIYIYKALQTPLIEIFDEFNCKLDLSNCATKADLKNHVNTSKFDKKVDLANLKSNVDKVDIDKLKNYQLVSTVWEVK